MIHRFWSRRAAGRAGRDRAFRAGDRGRSGPFHPTARIAARVAPRARRAHGLLPRGHEIHRKVVPRHRGRPARCRWDVGPLAADRSHESCRPPAPLPVRPVPGELVTFSRFLLEWQIRRRLAADSCRPGTRKASDREGRLSSTQPSRGWRAGRRRRVGSTAMGMLRDGGEVIPRRPQIGLRECRRDTAPCGRSAADDPRDVAPSAASGQDYSAGKGMTHVRAASTVSRHGRCC